VTIAAGFHCEDGIILCADTEQSDDYGKYQKGKVFIFEDKLVVTGAGTSDYIKMASDKLFDMYRSVQPADAFAARVQVEEVILAFHEKHIFQFWGANDGSRPTVSLIIALRCLDGSPVMIKTSDSAALLAGPYESVGMGTKIFEYWTQMLYHPALTMNLASYLCAFIVREVKANVLYCGGHTSVAGIPNDANRKASPVVYPDVSVFAGFPRTVIPLLLQCRDLRISDEEFGSRIKEFEAGLLQVRQQERGLTNMKEMMKHNLPLPDAAMGSEEATRILAAEKERLSNKSKQSTSEKSEPEP
jgi:hypothetical protein